MKKEKVIETFERRLKWLLAEAPSLRNGNSRAYDNQEIAAIRYILNLLTPTTQEGDK